MPCYATVVQTCSHGVGIFFTPAPAQYPQLHLSAFSASTTHAHIQHNLCCKVPSHMHAPHADSDIVYTLKPAWASYMAFIEDGHAEAAFQAEGNSGEHKAKGPLPVWGALEAHLPANSGVGEQRPVTTPGLLSYAASACLGPPTLEAMPQPNVCDEPHCLHPPPHLQTPTFAPAPATTVNGGSYVVLPTPSAVELFSNWSSHAKQAIAQRLHDQDILNSLIWKAWYKCVTHHDCHNMHNDVSAPCRQQARVTMHWAHQRHTGLHSIVKSWLGACMALLGTSPACCSALFSNSLVPTLPSADGKKKTDKHRAKGACVQPRFFPVFVGHVRPQVSPYPV